MMRNKKVNKMLASALVIAGMLLSSFGLQGATSVSRAGVVSTASGNLNVRASASTSAPILTGLPKGSYITLISQTGSWWKVEYASGSYGYASAGYITEVTSNPAAVTLTSGSLNVRTGAGTGFAIQDTLSSGKVVLVLSNANGWSRILYNGRMTGYVSSRYLTAGSDSSAKMIWPVPASTRLNQQFISGQHNGIDIGASTPGVPGDPVVAAVGGTVVYSGALNGYGYVAYINSIYNGQYIQTRYAHLKNAPSVKVGDTVTAGQLVGLMGNTGTSTGVHLHFEVRIRSSSAECMANADSTPVNPLNYISIP